MRVRPPLRSFVFASSLRRALEPSPLLTSSNEMSDASPLFRDHGSSCPRNPVYFVLSLHRPGSRPQLPWIRVWKGLCQTQSNDPGKPSIYP